MLATFGFTALLMSLPAGGCTDPLSSHRPGGDAVDPQLALEPGSATLSVGETLQLRVTGGSALGPGPSYAPLPAVWSSSDVEIAEVSAGGLVTAKGAGGAIITVTGPAGRGTSTVTVQ
jgi:hypothetical protein